MTEVQTIDQTIAQRRGRYGPLIESGEVAMKLEDYLRSLPGWECLAYDQRESLAMITHKISRIMCGDPDYDDSWVDIAGYAQNVVNRLRSDQNVPKPEEHKPAEVFEASGIAPLVSSNVQYANALEKHYGDSCGNTAPVSLLSSEVKLK